MAADGYHAVLIGTGVLDASMQRKKLVALACLTVCIPSVVLIAALVGETEPLTVDPAGVAGVGIGSVVSVEGYVADEGVKVLGGSATCRIVGPDGGWVRLFLRFLPDGLGAGDRIRVVGTVGLYQGAVEVAVDRSSALQVLARNPHPPASLRDVVADPWRFDGLEPRLRGTVTRAPVAMPSTGGWWSVIGDGSDDGEGAVAVVVLPEAADLAAWRLGASVELVGRVRYDGCRGLFYVEALEWAALD
jgi:hypothetical protein